PYLVGESGAMNELDAVRAARSIDAADAGADVAVWGHSQGGHVALFTGQLAPVYAPELNIVGVAAGAPVPDLVELFKVNVATTVGKILISMALQS
ncbi:MAG: lipase, partial [Acidimicrobiia bacterium]|nr:lipase [Acidimicrobiia bacterium]